MNRRQPALEQFHPLIARWFSERVGQPTDLQERAWPHIAGGNHALITAPTGSGKTLAAFLWAINQLVTGEWPLGHISVLYVSPLKALNNDIQRNLLRPLDELKHGFERAHEPFPAVRVLTRSGDTPQSDRRRMQRHPPEILITTPESLNLLLSSQGGRAMLTEILTVILDEVHAVVGNKRGVHLITAVDRLVPLAGEFQRIALSATIKPLQAVAEFIGGYQLAGTSQDPIYFPRRVNIVISPEKKQYALRVQFPEEVADGTGRESFWEKFVREIKKIVLKNDSTLVFCNSRRLCEKLTHLINQDETRPIAYAHHGSLSREIREEVEQKLKAGKLKAIVATSSLELGIDIGSLDEVILIQSPPSISSAIQRIGRAGHRVGEVSRATLFPTHSQDFLEAAVLAGGVNAHDIDTTKPLQCPLDVLAQVVISMVGTETWNADDLYVQLKTSYPYRSLGRREFDLVLKMLAGRYADNRIRELQPRISTDRLDNTVAARKGALQALYLSGGTIPDRGYFHLRHYQTGSIIGELDEEFVWEAKIGQTLTLGAQNWKIERITHSDVFVLPATSRLTAPPFWRAEENLRDFHFSECIGKFLEEFNGRLDNPDLNTILKETHCMEEKAAEQLIDYLKKQKEATGCPLPHRHHLLVEFSRSGPGGYPGNQVVLHTIWGGRVNQPFAMALEAAWEIRFNHQLEVYSGNDCVVLLLPDDISAQELLSLVTSANLQRLLKKRIEHSGFFGARFRECAGRALLLNRTKINERMPLWLSRLRSQKLLDSVLEYDDFPLLLETWRTCLKDEFDLEALLHLLRELESGSIAWTETHTTTISPMARGLTWEQINQYMYMDDQVRSGKTSRLASSLLQDVVFSPELRPPLPKETIRQFELKRQRLSSGYSPDSAQDLLDWVKERVLLPLSEWKNLVKAMEIDHGAAPEVLLNPVSKKLVRIHPPEASEPLVVALEMVPRIISSLYPEKPYLRAEWLHPEGMVVSPNMDDSGAKRDPEEVPTPMLGNWLQFYGPRTFAFIHRTLGVEREFLQAALEDLIDTETLITGRLVKGSGEEFLCDSENFEALLRLLRAEARPLFEPLGIEQLQPFLAAFQGLTNHEDHIDMLFKRIEQLLCFPLPAALWESEIFPARLQHYDKAWLDTLVEESDLHWIGHRGNRVSFYFEPDLDLMSPEENAGGKNADPPDRSKSFGGKTISGNEREIEMLFPDDDALYDFSALLLKSKLRPAELAARLWKAVWEGRVVNTSFAPLRRGIETGFKVTELTTIRQRTPKRRHRSFGRRAFSSWKGSLPAGNWRRRSKPSLGDDLIEAEERRKDRARLLLDRYGIVFRETLQHELPAFRWSEVFRALRLMELSGEVLSGYFFDGIPGPQFISREAFQALQRGLPDEAVYWLSAADPASLCGIPLDALKNTLPRRVPGTHLVYRGSRLILISQRNGKMLTFNVPAGDAGMEGYLSFLRHLLTRQFKPLRRILIESINGEDAAQSPYVEALRKIFDVQVDYRNVILYRSEV